MSSIRQERPTEGLEMGDRRTGIVRSVRLHRLMLVEDTMQRVTVDSRNLDRKGLLDDQDQSP